MIMPILGSLAQKHLRVIRRTHPASAVFYEKRLVELYSILGETYPQRLTLPEQGAFQLGYYFEKQKRYIPRKNDNVEETNV